jgi:uncharacterized protein YozE (UPF0346 family)
MTGKQTFQQWLAQQSKRDDSVGDLARDVQQDSETPRGNAKLAWRKHLIEMNACAAALQTLERAWVEYTTATMEIA